MSQIEVWGTGKPIKGFTEDAVLTSARKGFPKAKAQDIARFIAGKRFIITHAKDEASAQRLIEGLAKSGIEADTLGPPPDVKPEEIPATEEMADEETLMEELDATAAEPAPIPKAAGSGKRWKLIGGVAALLVVGIAASVYIAQQRQKAIELETQARIEERVHASLAAKFKSEEEEKRRATEEAAAKAKADAEQAERHAQQEAAIAEINSAFADGNYPTVIALSERFEGMYGLDPRVAKLEENATFTLQEGARRGNFAAILDTPIKNSVRFNALRQWALQVQERAKPRQ